MTYAWDLETNTRRSTTFTVSHIRHTKKGDYALTDPREIYENMANMGARRLRACIIGIVPGDIMDAAEAKCEETLRKGSGKPLEDRIRDMVLSFRPMGVTQEQIEKRLGHDIKACSEVDVVGLAKIYKSIRDGFAPAEEFFPRDMPEKSRTQTLADRLQQDNPPQPEPVETAPEPAASQEAEPEARRQSDQSGNDIVRGIIGMTQSAKSVSELKALRNEASQQQLSDDDLLPLLDEIDRRIDDLGRKKK